MEMGNARGVTFEKHNENVTYIKARVPEEGVAKVLSPNFL